jgi:Zn-dependent oligopeptidase
MEYFVRDWRSLKNFAMTPSGVVIGEAEVEEGARIKSMFRNIEKRQQTMYSEYDQELFGPSVPGDVCSSVILESLHGKYGIPYAKGTHWLSTFGHLNTYGAAYYAYPWAQGIADNVFSEMSKVGLMNRVSGEKFGKLLRPGGSKDPQQLVEESLGYVWQSK